MRRHEQSFSSETRLSETGTLARLRDSDMWWSFRRSPLVVTASVVTLLYFLGAVLAPWIAPYDPFDVKSLNLMDAFTPPAWAEGVHQVERLHVERIVRRDPRRQHGPHKIKQGHDRGGHDQRRAAEAPPHVAVAQPRQGPRFAQAHFTQ